MAADEGIPDLLDRLGIEYRSTGESPHVTTGWIGLVCPWCGEGTGKYGLGINLARGYCSCWKCGGHSLPAVLHALTRKPYGEVKGWLKDLPFQDREEPKPRGKLSLPPGLGPLLPLHRSYLEGRGLDPEHTERFWGVKGIGLSSRLAWRLWLPIAYRGETVSWTTRACHDTPAGPRYLGAKPEEEKLRAKDLLYGEDHVRNTVVVCEGPLDVLRIGPGAVATLGVGYTGAQVRKLVKYSRRVLCFDREEGAQQRAKRLCRELSCFPGETLNVVLEAEDPGSASREEVRELRRRFLE